MLVVRCCALTFTQSQSILQPLKLSLQMPCCKTVLAARGLSLSVLIMCAAAQLVGELEWEHSLNLICLVEVK